MRTTTSPRRAMRSLLLVNGCVALITSAGALVVLLIAPLGLAAVLSCTLLVALLSFAAGLLADVLLWRILGAPGALDAGAAGGGSTSLQAGRGRALQSGQAARLPEPRQR